MYLRTYIPPPPRDQHVELMAFYRGYMPQGTLEQLMPDGAVELLISLDEIERRFYDDAQRHERARVRKTWVMGIQQRTFFANADVNSSLFSIKFKSGGSFPFLGVPLSELNDQFVDGSLLLGTAVSSLREQMLNAPQDETLFGLAEQFLRHRLMQHEATQAVSTHVVTQLAAFTGQPQIKDLAQHVGYSQKQLIQIFKKYVGVRPKYFQRLERFKQALGHIYESGDQNWAQLSTALGFYDQAHLINEFKHFSGHTPRAYVRQRGEFINFLPIDEPPDENG